MKKILSCILSLSIVHCSLSIAFAQEPEIISEAQAMQQEIMQTMQTDSPNEETYDDNLTPQQKFEENPKHNVHDFNYKQQVIVGGIVMLCVTLAMVSNNNYNPKRGR